MTLKPYEDLFDKYTLCFNSIWRAKLWCEHVTNRNACCCIAPLFMKAKLINKVSSNREKFKAMLHTYYRKSLSFPKKFQWSKNDYKVASEKIVNQITQIGCYTCILKLHIHLIVTTSIEYKYFILITLKRNFRNESCLNSHKT